MASAYGIDMGNVMAVRNRIAANKLARAKIKRGMEVEDAGFKNRLISIKNAYPDMGDEQVKNMALNPEEFEYNRDRKDKEEDRNARLKNAYSRIDYQNKRSKQLAKYKEDIKQDFRAKEVNRRKTILKANHPDMSDDLVEAYANDQSKDFIKIAKFVADAESEDQIDAVVSEMNKQGGHLYAITTIEDPERQQNEWSKWRNGVIKAEQDPASAKKRMEEIPEQYDPTWATMTMTSGVEIMETAQKAKNILKQTAAEIKLEKEKTNPKPKGPTYSQITTKIEKISKAVDRYFKDLDDPEAALAIKAEAEKRWKEKGMKHNTTSIVKEVIKEWEDKQGGEDKEEGSFFGNMFGGDKKEKNKQNNLGKPIARTKKPDGEVERNGKTYIIKDGLVYNKK